MKLKITSNQSLLIKIGPIVVKYLNFSRLFTLLHELIKLPNIEGKSKVHSQKKKGRQPRGIN